MDEDSQDFSAWIGNTETATDLVTASAVCGMSATLDRDDPVPRDGDPLPPLWHFMLFASKVRQSELGPDGHPARGGFMPPIALPRRMFAGARYRFHQPLHVGEHVRRDAEILDITHKAGKTGALVFVKIDYRISGEHGLAIEEQHDVVYRGATAPAQPSTDRPPVAVETDWRATFTPDPVCLFRYSALTFNSHRIHYDRTYTTEQEGYPGLVVHGPLIAMLLMELARCENPGRMLEHFSFRAKRALFDLHPFETVGGVKTDDTNFWVKAVDHLGHVAMDAEGGFTE